MTLNPRVLDAVERIGWTFIQALAGSIVAAGTASSLQTWDWRSALAGAGTAALICAFKVLSVQVISPPAPPAAPDWPGRPAPAPDVTQAIPTYTAPARNPPIPLPTTPPTTTTSGGRITVQAQPPPIPVWVDPAPQPLVQPADPTARVVIERDPDEPHAGDAPAGALIPVQPPRPMSAAEMAALSRTPGTP